MVIINRLKKTIAALMALTISATSMGAISADAYGITYCKDSEFKYEMSASILSDTQIELTVDVTNNPGFYRLGLIIHYEGCKPSHCAKVWNADSGFQIIGLPLYNEKTKNYSFGFEMLNLDEPNSDYTDNLSLRYVFNVDNAYEDICQFAAGIVSYSSHTEGIEFRVDATEFESYKEHPVTTTHDGISYIVGDMDNDGIIDISDASSINRLVSFTENKQGISVWKLNSIISHGAWGESYNSDDFDFGSAFPDLLCAEVADTTYDRNITLEDSEEVLTCYANNMAAIPYEGLTGKVQIKKILVPVPNNI